MRKFCIILAVFLMWGAVGENPLATWDERLALGLVGCLLLLGGVVTRELN
jgi:hypothetical protein